MCVSRRFTAFNGASKLSKGLQLRVQPVVRVMSSPVDLRKRGGKPSYAPVQASSKAVSAATSGDVKGSNDIQGDMLEPSLANKTWVRLIALSATVAIAARSTAFLSSSIVGFIHMLTFGTWFGTVAYTSFVVGIVAFKNLPRQTFGKLQSKLFPIYFAISSAAPAILLATMHALTAGTAPKKEVILLVTSLVASLFNMVIAEPVATKIMFARYDLENASGPRDEDAIKKLKAKFGMWHGISSLGNLAVLVCAVGHAFFLGTQLTF